jgi:hypothetical protein
MLIVLLVVAILIIVVGILFDSDRFAFLCGFALVLCIAGIVWASIFISCGVVIDEIIAMYEEENTKIEQAIDELVDEYMKYEGETFEKCSTESSMTLVSLYPELKSDKLVKSQINTHKKNNNKIKELKEKQLDIRVAKWWLYFGGGK